MSTEDNKARARRIPDEAFNKGNLVVLNEVLLDDFVEHVPLAPGQLPGREGFKGFVSMLRAAFPDLHYTTVVELAEGDKVAQHVTVRGTHKGEFAGIPATGKQVTWTETHISRHSGGKIVEHWADLDQLGMLQQLGVIPAPQG